MKNEQIKGLFRHTLTFIGGILVMRGIIDQELALELTGAILTIVGGVLSVMEKR